jgi:hypothetical protein
VSISRSGISTSKVIETGSSVDSSSVSLRRSSRDGIVVPVLFEDASSAGTVPSS